MSTADTQMFGLFYLTANNTKMLGCCRKTAQQSIF